MNRDGILKNYFDFLDFFWSAEDSFFLLLTFCNYGNKVCHLLIVQLKFCTILGNYEFFLLLSLAKHINILFALHVCDKKFIAEICICFTDKNKQQILSNMCLCVCVGDNRLFRSVFLTCCVFLVHLDHIGVIGTQLEINKLFFKFHFTIVRICSFRSYGRNEKRRFFVLCLCMLKWTLELRLYFWRLPILFLHR